jgi:hypothetical protein
MASQLSLIATNDQHGFNWKQVGLSALAAGATAGLGSAGVAGSVARTTGSVTLGVAAQAALANAVSQGIGVATGLQSSFNWKATAASAVGAGVTEAIAPTFANAFGDTVAGQFGTRLATGLVAGGAAALARGGRVAVQQTVYDSFGNSLAYSMGGGASSPDSTTLPTGDFARADRAAYELQQSIEQSDAIQSKRFAEMDAYTPASEYDYRNGMDVRSDQAWDLRVTSEIQRMKIPDYAKQLAALNRSNVTASAAKAVWDGGASAGRGFVNPADAYLYGGPFAGRSTITDPSAYVTDQQRFRRLIDMSDEPAENHTIGEWTSSAAEYKQLSGKGFTRDAIYNGLWTKAAQLRIAAGDVDRDIFDQAAGVGIEAGSHADVGISLAQGTGKWIGTAMSMASKGSPVVVPEIGSGVPGEIAWSSKAVKDANRALSIGATEVNVANRSEAEELFLARYAGQGYRNVTGMSPTESKNLFGTKTGSYHWDVGAGAYPHEMDHLQVHTYEGPVVRIYFR